MKTVCAECTRVGRWLYHEVLPSIRKNGYYSPEGADVDSEFYAMQQQAGLRDKMRLLLSDIDDDLSRRLFRDDMP
ncbi:hypothetical protein BJF85_00490 [Saccharomonospora sp. CUA-673]|nr:hypothetical protein BJF85_00490 [Saccharomonospora sp. CUA-673]